MKRALALSASVLALLGALAACGGDEEEPEDDAGTEDSGSDGDQEESAGSGEDADDPLAADATADLTGEWGITILDVEPDGAEAVAAQDSAAEAPGEGER